ncbi:MAG: FkbM family methyltransferase [Candidatus Pacebacteria bacterium]|nr:FkbM family methyltransferase [Candidatus Paceibacterota bacterium]
MNIFKLIKKHILKTVKAFNPYSKVFFAQYAEDLILENIFINKGNGFYVDIGANHPFRFSNTYSLYLKGWRGINIEPNPDLVKLFDIFRKRDINIQMGISDKSELLYYYQFDDSALNNFSEKKTNEILKNTKYKLIKKSKIELKKLDYILEKYLPVNKIDFISIDAETMDLKVLKSNDWKRFSPEYILIEKLSKSNEIDNFLTNRGYSVYCKMNKTNFYKKIK